MKNYHRIFQKCWSSGLFFTLLNNLCFKRENVYILYYYIMYTYYRFHIIMNLLFLSLLI